MLKRYWKLIVLVIVIVLTIGTFYMKQSFASNNYPEMKVQTKNGDEKVADNLVLHTNIRTRCEECRGTGGGHNVSVTAEGSTSEENTFLEEIKGNKQDTKIARLQQDHRNFMRGKPEDPLLFAENKDMVVYADFDLNDYRVPRQNHNLSVDWLDKRNHDRSTFDLQLPDHEQYWDTYVRHVFLADGQLKVVTENRKSNSDATGAEIHVYTIDRDAGKIMDDDTLLTGADNRNNIDWADMSVVADEEAQGETESLILVKEKGTFSDTDDGVEISDKQLMYYDLRTNKREKLSLPSELQEQTIEGFHDKKVFFSDQKDGKAKITAFDTTDQKITDTHTFNISDLLTSPEVKEFVTQVRDGKFYIVSDGQKKKQGTAVMIADIKSGDIVYEGTITMDDVLSNYDVFINGISFEEE